MAEENIEVSAGCSHERLQFGHALPHLFFSFFFFLDSQNFGSVGSVKQANWSGLNGMLKLLNMTLMDRHRLPTSY